MNKKLFLFVSFLALSSCSGNSVPTTSPTPTGGFITPSPTSTVQPTPSEPLNPIEPTVPSVTPSPTHGQVTPTEPTTPSMTPSPTHGDPTPSEPTPTNVYEKTTVEYTLVQREINGHLVPTHMLEIKLKSVTDLRSCFATNEEGEYGVNIYNSLHDLVNKTKEKEGLDILGAVNGDYTFSSETRKGYSVKDGIIYRTEQRSKGTTDLVFTKDNSVYIMKEGEFELDGEVGEESEKYWQIISFGPIIVENSQIVVAEDYELGGNTWVNNQRTCIGIIDWNHFYLVSTEANKRSSKELQSYKIHELGVLLLEYGCHTVYNLDGGYSSGLAFNNEVQFAPTRLISDILYVVDE